jgi:hypothetical protein
MKRWQVGSDSLNIGQLSAITVKPYNEISVKFVQSAESMT